jgi:hypothetical protein
MVWGGEGRPREPGVNARAEGEGSWELRKWGRPRELKIVVSGEVERVGS